VSAGSSVTTNWDFGAEHVGDCFFYLSYSNPATTSAVDMRWFKIAAIAECKDMTRQDVPVAIPSWAPAGKAVLRFEWYALHRFPAVEFYAQCADIVVTRNSGSGVLGIPLVKVPGHLPENGNNGEYRDPFNGGTFFFTGPAVAVAGTSSGSSTPSPTSATTPKPTSGQSASTPSPTRAPTRTPTRTPTASTTTNAPTKSPTQGSSGCRQVWQQCGGQSYTGSTCCTTGNKCQFYNNWWSQCVPGSQAQEFGVPAVDTPKTSVFENRESFIAVGSGVAVGLVIGAVAILAFIKFSNAPKVHKNHKVSVQMTPQ
jgi:hypothetical protein